MAKTVYQTVTELRDTHGISALENDRTVLTRFDHPVAIITRLPDDVVDALMPLAAADRTDEIGLPRIDFQDFYKKFKLELCWLQKHDLTEAVITRKNYNGPNYKQGQIVPKAVVTLLGESDQEMFERAVEQSVDLEKIVDDLLGFTVDELADSILDDVGSWVEKNLATA